MASSEKQSHIISVGDDIVRTYMVYSALLAVKLLSLSPLIAISWVKKGVFANPDIVRRAYITELKSLTPFWIVGALYITTKPPAVFATSLFRVYSFSRTIVTLGHAVPLTPAPIRDAAILISFLITTYMTVWVVYCYRHAL